MLTNSRRPCCPEPCEIGRSPDACIRVPVNRIAKRSNIGSTGSPCIRPRGAEQQAVQDQNHEPTARGSAPSGDLFWSRLLRAPEDQGEYWGRLLLVTFLGEARKVTGPARPRSALAARQNILILQSRSWFDKLTTNGGHGARWWRDKTRWLVSICGGLKPTLRGLRTLRRRRDRGHRHPFHHPP